ncbi:hypothetical protein D3C80_1739550 [compost metagenome]
MRHHQQAVGEPDTDQHQPDSAQQRQGRANRDGGKTRTPEQQRGFADTAPFDRQVQGSRRCQSDGDGQHRGWIKRHIRIGLLG